METFIKPKKMVENPRYRHQRRKALAGLREEELDAPIIELVRTFNRLPHCFTLQSCYGHFVCAGQQDPANLKPLPAVEPVGGIEYRLAYICICVQPNPAGKGLLEALKAITAVDPQHIQFGCATWFWEKQVNSYALQVQPDRFKHQDTAMLAYREALHVEKIRNRFFAEVANILHKKMGAETAAAARSARFTPGGTDADRP